MLRTARRNRARRAFRLPASTEFPRRSLFRSFVCAPASAREQKAWIRLYREHWPAGQAGSVYVSPQWLWSAATPVAAIHPRNPLALTHQIVYGRPLGSHRSQYPTCWLITVHGGPDLRRPADDYVTPAPRQPPVPGAHGVRSDAGTWIAVRAQCASSAGR